jgi:hypothetical protein
MESILYNLAFALWLASLGVLSFVLGIWFALMRRFPRGANRFALLMVATVLVVETATSLLTKGLTHAALKRFIDLVPSHKLRKRLSKLLAEEAHQAAALRKAGRPGAARWIEMCTWGLAAWYIAAAPIAALWSLLREQSGAAK